MFEKLNIFGGKKIKDNSYDFEKSPYFEEGESTYLGESLFQAAEELTTLLSGFTTAVSFTQIDKHSENINDSLIALFLSESAMLRKLTIPKGKGSLKGKINDCYNKKLVGQTSQLELMKLTPPILLLKKVANIEDYFLALVDLDEEVKRTIYFPDMIKLALETGNAQEFAVAINKLVDIFYATGRGAMDLEKLVNERYVNSFILGEHYLAEQLISDETSPSFQVRIFNNLENLLNLLTDLNSLSGTKYLLIKRQVEVIKEYYYYYVIDSSNYNFVSTEKLINDPEMNFWTVDLNEPYQDFVRDQGESKLAKLYKLQKDLLPYEM